MRWLRGGIATVLLFAGSTAFAQMSSEDCLACHQDSELVKEVGGKSVSVHVDPEKFAASKHGSFGCTDCHESIADYPHEKVVAVNCANCHDGEAATVAKSVHAHKANCSSCHGNHQITQGSAALASCSRCHEKVVSAQRESLHGKAATRGDKLAPTCVTCHGSHEISSHLDPKAKTAVMNVPLLCGSCHREGSPVSLSHNIPQQSILENYRDSIHGEGLFRKGLTVTAVCTSCHTSHFILPHTDPRSSIAKVNIAKTCTQCHGRIEEVHRKVIEGQLWEQQPNKIPACPDCHQPHKVRRVFYDAGMANKDCLTCHGKPELTMVRGGKRISIYADAQEYAASRHQQTACAQCHTEVSPSHSRPCETIKSKVDCSICHAAQVNDYKVSMHGQLAAKGDPDAPHCLDCHDDHATTSKRTPGSPTYARSVPKLCARCHREGEKAAVRIKTGVKDIIGTYADSIHGKGLTESGLVVTATCVNCHSSHRELPPTDPRSTVNPANLATTCGTCHNGIEEAFEMSIHATAKPKPGQKLPTCNDCHTSHAINRTDLVGFRTRMMDQCGRCHDEQAKTFFDTFHGKVSLLGTEGAAKCSDCHGQHNIMPVDDPRSTLSHRNVVTTCGKCHAGSNRKFAGYLTHATHHDPDKYPWLYWSFRFMVGLLVGTLAFFLIHTLLWLFRLVRTRHHWIEHKESDEGQVYYKRFKRFQRWQHAVMIVSFFTLALTGMALKFSYATWAQGIAWLFGGGQTMGYVHRFAAVVLIILFTYHLATLVKRKREGKLSWLQMLSGPDTLMFTLTDVRQIWQSFMWFFGRAERPKYGRYTYWEKFDYFAVFWGVLVIGSTGFVLWFPEFFTRLIPGWTINVATIIHSDEALLAVAFIFTIHFFNTHFRPDKFPMDPVIFTGRIPIDEFKFDKPAEYDELVATGKLEEHLAGPIPKQLEKVFKVFGFIALAIGLTLVGLIIYAMVFAYK
jgi:predicted CXXCH cytochrome family protein